MLENTFFFFFKSKKTLHKLLKILQQEPLYSILFSPAVSSTVQGRGKLPQGTMQWVGKGSPIPSKDRANNTIVSLTYKTLPTHNRGRRGNSKMFPQMQASNQEPFSKNYLRRYNCRNASSDCT